MCGEARGSATVRPFPSPPSQPGIVFTDAGLPGAIVLQRIIGVGDEVQCDEEVMVGEEMSPLKGQTSGVLTIYALGTDALAGRPFDDRLASPRAKRWVPYDAAFKATNACEVPKSAPAMRLVLTFPSDDDVRGALRRVRVFAVFGGTELRVRAEIVVDGVVRPEYGREVPVTYPE